MEFPEVISPAELAKRLGWSERRIRVLARELGACRILGNRMALTKEDVDAILEATRQAPMRPARRRPRGRCHSAGCSKVICETSSLPLVSGLYSRVIPTRNAKFRRATEVFCDLWG